MSHPKRNIVEWKEPIRGYKHNKFSAGLGLELVLGLGLVWVWVWELGREKVLVLVLVLALVLVLVLVLVWEGNRSLGTLPHNEETQKVIPSLGEKDKGHERTNIA